MADPTGGMGLTSPYGFAPNLSPGGGAAPGGGANMGGFANILGSLLNYGTQTNAINTATNSMNQGYGQAQGVTNAALTNSQNAFAPYLASGKTALNTMNSGNIMDPNQQNIMNFAQQQGQAAIQNSAAAGGQFFSPETMQALSQFNQQNAGQFYQQAWNNLFQQSNQGLTATTSQTGQQNQLAQQLAQLFTGQSTMQAGSAMAGGGAQTGLINSLVSSVPSIISAAPTIASFF